MQTRTVLVVLLALLGCVTAQAQSTSAPVNVSNTSGLSVSPAAVISPSGTLHVAWADSAGESDAFHHTVRYAQSFDGGRTFSPSRELSGTDDTSLRSAREVRIVADRPDAVVIAWWDTTADLSGRTFATVFVAVSRDDGATFGAPVETSLRFRDDVAPKEGFTNLTSLSVAAGAAGQIFLLATVQDYYHGFNVYFSRSTDGVAFSGPRRLSSYSGTIPRAATNALAVLPNNQLYAVWTESHGDFVDEIKDMFFVRSTDDGRTFSAPSRVAGARGVTGAVFRDDGSLRLLAQFQKGPRSNHVIRFFGSTDGGATFQDRVRLGEAASNSHLNQASIASNGAGTIAVAWAENSSRPGPAEGIYVAVSHDHGRTFDPPQRVLDGLYPDPPSVTVNAEGRVGVAYTSSELVADDREILFASIEP